MSEVLVNSIIGGAATIVATIAGVWVAHWLGNRQKPGPINGKPPGWPPGPEKVGVWMVRIKPEYAGRLGFPEPPNSYLHFSWDWSGRGTSYLRHYVVAGRPPQYRGPLNPAEVFRNLVGKPINYRKNERPQVTDQAAWYEETRRLNTSP